LIVRPGGPRTGLIIFPSKNPTRASYGAGHAKRKKPMRIIGFTGNTEK